MVARNRELEQARNVLASDGLGDRGVSGCAPLDQHCGRHIEADRSWAVYHPFTDRAHANDRDMTGFSLIGATDGMLLLDHYRDGRHDDRLGAMFCARFAPFTTKGSRR